MVKTNKTYRKRKGGMQSGNPHTTAPAAPAAPAAPPAAPTSAPTRVPSPTPPASPTKKSLFGRMTGMKLPGIPKLTLPKFTMGNIFTRRTGGGRRKGRKGKRKTKRKGGARRSRKKNKNGCTGTPKYKR